MMEIVYLLVSAVVGFVVGALVYRNNVKKVETELARLKADYDALLSKIVGTVK